MLSKTKDVMKKNLCFVMGKIISEIEFKFIINRKNISISIFDIELRNKSIIKVKGYNEIAELCYQKLVKSDNVFICGRLNNKMELIIKEIQYI